MAVVARVEAPTVGVDPLPNVRVTAQMNPNPLAPIAQGISSIGDVAQKFAMDEQEKANQAQYTDALTKSSMLENHLRDPANPDGTYAPETMGQGWAGLHDKVMPQLTAGQEAILNSVQSQPVREKLQAHFAQQAADFASSLNSMAVQRKEGAISETFKVGSATQLDDYATKLSMGDIGGASAALGNFDKIADAYAAQTGMSSDAIAMFKKQSVSESLRKVIENQIDTNPMAAQAAMEKLGTGMTFTDQLAVNSKLRPMLDAQIGSAAYDKYAGSGIPPVQTLPPSKDGATFADQAIGGIQARETGSMANAATAVSSKGATGTYQMEPATAAAAWARLHPGVPFDPAVLKDKTPQGQAVNAELAKNELAHIWDLCAKAGVAPDKRAAAAFAGYNMGAGAAVAWATGKPYRTEDGSLFTPKYPCDVNALPAETAHYIGGKLTAPMGYGGNVPARGDVIAAIQADTTLSPMQKRQALEKAAVVNRAQNENRIDQDRQESTQIWGAVNAAAQDPAKRGMTVAQILGPDLNAVAMGKEYYKSLEEHLKNPATVDDPATVNYVQDLYHKATVSNDPTAISAFVNTDITALSHDLKPETRQMFIDKQAELAKGENGPAGMSSSKLVEDAKAQMFSPDDKSAVTAQLRADFTTSYYALESLAKAKNGGHPLDVEQKRQLIDSLKKTTAMEVWNTARTTTMTNADGTTSQSFPMTNAFPKGADNNVHVPLYERMATANATHPEIMGPALNPAGVAKTAASNAVPATAIPAIIKSFRARFGKDPTPEQIRFGYEHGVGK